MKPPLILTTPQKRFVDAILSGKTQEEAYAAARFPRASSTKKGTVSKNGSDMLRNPVVAEALAHASARAVEASAITVQSLVEDLQASRRAAFSCEPPQISATVAATVAIAKLLGLYVDRREVEVRIAKPGFSLKALELTEDEWTSQFAKPFITDGTERNGR